ncbi:MAG: DUF2207 domain-containing protein [Muribaculaceae bacterium]|nr:DUF2207 domain-containing protein [Muribaculaceae bacterium]
MKKYLISLVLLIMSSLAARADEGGYTLDHVIVQAQISEDNTWDMSESLYVNFTEPRHGIYRYIPTAFSYYFPGPNGTDVEYKYRTMVDSIDVVPHHFEVDNDNTKAFNKIIQIGDPKERVTGLQKYFIHYRLRYLSDQYKGEDFLCHTLWGTGWNTQVDTLSAILEFKGGIPQGLKEKLHIYSGSLGTKTNADSVLVEIDEENKAIYILAYNLPANHAITLSAKLPEGTWKVHEKNTTPFYAWMAVAGVLGIVLILSYIKNAGKNFTRIVSFHPPADMTSAEVGKVMDDCVDSRDLASLIPLMAHRRYLDIKEIQMQGYHLPTLELSIKAPLTPNEPYYMQQFLEALFKDKDEDTVRLDNLDNRGYAFQKVSNSINEMYEGEYALTRTSTLAVWLWRIMVLALAIAVGFASQSDHFDSTFFGYTLLTSCAGMYYLGHRRRKEASDTWSWTTKHKVIDFLKWTAIGGFVIAVNINMINDGLMAVDTNHIILALAAAGFISYFTNRCVSSTPYRNELMGQLQGLRTFIETAEQDRLKMLVDEDPQYFYEILPYAIAFGLSDKWVSQFEHIAIEQPEWYCSAGNMTDFTTSTMMLDYFTRNASDSIRESVAAVTASSSSSSDSLFSGLFSGGGSSFSGGGGGGGGGGSW